LPEGKYSGVLGSPVSEKAAFKNFPYKYGIVERTYSEWKSSGFPSFLVNNFNNLPTELKASHGSIYGRRMWINIKWYDSGNHLIYENGAYGEIGRTVQDLWFFKHFIYSWLQ